MRGDKQERIIRVLLNNKGLSKYRVSKLAETSFSWTHELLKKLEKKWLIKGTKVLNYEGLIRYWGQIRHSPQKIKRYMIPNPRKILKETKLDYALTTYLAENLVQKYLFPSRFDIYIKMGDLEKWHRYLVKAGALIGTFSTGNMKVIVTDEHVFDNKRKINGFWIVSKPQLIVDLLSEGGPCEEAAEMLLKCQKS